MTDALICRHSIAARRRQPAAPAALKL